MFDFLSAASFGLYSPSRKPLEQKTVTLPPPSMDGGASAVTVEPDTFAGQIGKGVGGGLKWILIGSAVLLIVVFAGPQLVAMFTRSTLSAVKG